MMDSNQGKTTNKATDKATLKERILRILGHSLDQAMEEPPPDKQEPSKDQEPNLEAVLASIMERLDKIEAAMAGQSINQDETEPDMGNDMATGNGEGEVVEVLAQAIAALAGNEPDAKSETVTVDAATMARAEILAPGIPKGEDLQGRALRQAHATADGKRVIDGLLCGKDMATLGDAERDILFVAAAQGMAAVRRSQQRSSDSAMRDALSHLHSGPVDATKLNEINAKHYAAARR